MLQQGPAGALLCACLLHRPDVCVASSGVMQDANMCVRQQTALLHAGTWGTCVGWLLSCRRFMQRYHPASHGDSMLAAAVSDQHPPQRSCVDFLTLSDAAAAAPLLLLLL